MNITEKLRIAGYEISIKIDEDILAERNHIGEYAPKYQEIRIAPGMTDQQERQTLIHEMLEAINSIYSLDLRHDDQLEIIAVALHQVFKDNHEIVDFLKG